MLFIIEPLPPPPTPARDVAGRRVMSESAARDVALALAGRHAQRLADSRSTGFGNISVELDAIDPNALCALVQETIEQHPHQFPVLKPAEQSEREAITSLVGKVTS